MKIGIIGPLDSGEKISSVMNKHFPELVPQIYEVSKIEEAYLEMDRYERECDGLIFTGIGVYHKIIEKRDVAVPHIYVPFLASSIVRAFWELKKLYPDCNHVSIDIVNKLDIEDVLDDMGLHHLNFESIEYNHLYSENKYVDFHVEAHKKDESLVSIIGLGWVHEQVKDLGYPTIRLYSTKITIKDTINRLLYRIKEEIVKDANLAVQIIDTECQLDISQYRKLEISSQIQSNLIGYLKEIQGSIFSLSWKKYLIFSTRGAVENKDNLSRLKNVLDYMKKDDIKVFVGTGIGMTSYESEVNANKALEAAKEQGYSCIYKVEDDNIEGPLLEEGELSYSFIMDNDEINRIAEMIDLSPLYVQKISSIKEKYGKDSFTSDELAKYLDISIRTANRILKKILDSNCGEEVGIESNKSVGRPKKIIKIDFNINKL